MEISFFSDAIQKGLQKTSPEYIFHKKKDVCVEAQRFHRLRCNKPQNVFNGNVRGCADYMVYGWVFLRNRICRYGCILECVPTSLRKFIENRLKTAKNRQKSHHLKSYHHEEITKNDQKYNEL